jgi:hypothetical protein
LRHWSDTRGQVVAMMVMVALAGSAVGEMVALLLGRLPWASAAAPPRAQATAGERRCSGPVHISMHIRA